MMATLRNLSTRFFISISLRERFGNPDKERYVLYTAAHSGERRSIMGLMGPMRPMRPIGPIGPISPTMLLRAPGQLFFFSPLMTRKPMYSAGGGVSPRLSSAGQAAQRPIGLPLPLASIVHS